MAFFGLCSVTIEGKRRPGRPTNDCRNEIEDLQKCFMGKLTTDIKDSGVSLYRGDSLVLRFSKNQSMKANIIECCKNAVEVSFNGKDVETTFFPNALKGYQDGYRIIIAMFFIHYIRDEVLPPIDAEKYQRAIESVENNVRETNKRRQLAIKKLATPALNDKPIFQDLESLMSRGTAQKLITALNSLRSSPKTPPSAIPRQYPYCSNFHCQCGYCVQQKESRKLQDNHLRDEAIKKEVKIEAENHFDQEKQRIQEEFDAERKLWEEKLQALEDSHRRQLSEQNQIIRELKMQIQQLQNTISGKDEKIDRLEGIVREKDSEIRELRSSSPEANNNSSRKVYITKTGQKYHTSPCCPGLSRANAIESCPLKEIHFQTKCLRC